MLLGYEKEGFLHLPTPIEYLPNISKDLGIELYIKRDDLTPLAMGGNKLRKLEYFLFIFVGYKFFEQKDSEKSLFTNLWLSTN